MTSDGRSRRQISRAPATSMAYPITLYPGIPSTAARIIPWSAA